MFSIDFFYSVDKQSKNIGFCGTSLKDSQEADNIFQLLEYSDNITDKKFVKSSGKDTLKEIFYDISEFKNIASIIQIPKTRLQTAFLSVSNSIIPDLLLKDRLFKPPKIS
jgi:hypothetical protein